MNLTDLITMIRFGLAQLSEHNGHHEFEHLSRHFARARIAANILPATGPVSAGGDQGRDFETFRTHLASIDIASATFVARAADGPLAFLCTLQKTEISQKIRSDVAKIMKAGPAVQGIYAFLATGLPVAHRNRLKTWAREKHGVELEILDGQALAEQLSDPDLFWIAARYLSIPSEMYPRPTNEPSWYTRRLEAWRLKVEPRYTAAEFAEVKSALRAATFDEGLRTDLPFWILVTQDFAQHGPTPALRRKAIYEVTVATLRGLGTMHGLEEGVRTYFSALPSLTRLADLEDATILLQYCAGATLRDTADLTVDEQRAWFAQLTERLDSELVAAPQETRPNSRCGLLEIRGSAAGIVDVGSLRPPAFSDTLRYWLELAQLLPQAPLFPLERFAERAVDLADLLDGPPEFDELLDHIDEELPKRTASNESGHRFEVRARKLLERGDEVRALHYSHRAKLAWFGQESLAEFVWALLAISQAYQRLKLPWAAKYYAMGAAYMSAHAEDFTVQQKLPLALFNVADANYAAGQWGDFLSTLQRAQRAHQQMMPDPLKLGKHEEVQRSVAHLAVIRVLCEQLTYVPPAFIQRETEETGLTDIVEIVIETARETYTFSHPNQVWQALEEQMSGPPFADLGPRRIATWEQLGLMWSVEWENNQITTALAEQFLAAAQVFLADIAHIDLELLPTSVQVEITVAPVTDLDVRPVHGNEGRSWTVVFPAERESWQDVQLWHRRLFSVLLTILTETSVMAFTRFERILRERFEENVSEKIVVVKPYCSLYDDLFPEEQYLTAERIEVLRPQPYRPFQPQSAPAMAWSERLSATYSLEEAHISLQRRYDALLPAFNSKHRVLLNNSEIKQVITELREEGWKDWHLLTAIIGMTANAYVNSNMPHSTSSRALEGAWKGAVEAMKQNHLGPAPWDGVYTREALQRTLDASMHSTLLGLGYEPRQRVPDLPAVRRFLRVRHNYWTDDIEHPDPFES